MGKKGSKRKTRWRTLSIGAPPGEEDGEEGELRNGYNVRTQENGTNSRLYERQNGQNGGYNKGGFRNGPGNNHHHSNNSAVPGKGKRNDDSMETNSQPKIIFNEDEYTRITTPRQDVLFKKGYLSKKKPWASTASTSATPSTTESQSASHSTADGSETTEDQQLLDRDCVPGDYPPISEPPQVGYGTFYDHASGYYYEYPVLVVGPALPGQMVPSALATVPCGPVPLRPIEWVNPAFVPKLSGQQYCLMDCQGMPTSECAALADAHIAPLKSESLNGTESTGGTGSCGGSVAEEENNTAETTIPPGSGGEQVDVEQNPEHIVLNGPTSYLEQQEHMNRHMVSSPGAVVAAATTPVPQAQPLHMTHMVPIPVSVPAPAPGPAVAAPPQPYLYPGHYMFGPPLVNVNGVTIQSLPMVRSTDISSISSSRRRKKKKRRKQRRPPMGDEEEDEEEEEEYSSECENNLSSSRLAWPEGAGEIIPSSDRGANRPLNPECQEFEPQTGSQPSTTPSTDPEPAGATTVSSPPPATACCNGHKPDAESLDSLKNEIDVICREETPNTTTRKIPQEQNEDHHQEKLQEPLTNGLGMHSEPESDEDDLLLPRVRSRLSNGERRNRYCGKITREATPGRELEPTTLEEREEKDEDEEVEVEVDPGVKEANIDSGFESQTTTVSSSEHPITDAVTEWLKRANSDSNSSDVFVTTKFLKERKEDDEDDEEDEDEDEEEDEDEDEDEEGTEGKGKREKEPPKNLQGNPMPALSVEARVDDSTRKSSTFVDCGGGFAKVARTTSAGSSSCIGGRCRRKRRRNKGHQEQAQDQDVCESTGQEDSVAGVRVALNSRMTETKRRSRRRTRPEQPEPAEDLKILCVNANHVETEVSVKTFEKGEIVVSLEGNKLLPGAIPLSKHEETEETIEEEEEEEVEGDRDRDRDSFDKNSIEELDVLECWEEPVITPRRMQSKGVLRDGEAEEEEEEEQLLEEIVDNLEYVKKYYTLAREIDGGSSVEEDDKSGQNCNRAVPKTPERMIASLCHEEVPRIGDSTGTKAGAGTQRERELELEVDEAFEVYESCYTDKSRLGLRVNGNRLPSLTPQEPPVPCKAVCCSIQ